MSSLAAAIAGAINVCQLIDLRCQRPLGFVAYVSKIAAYGGLDHRGERPFHQRRRTQHNIGTLLGRQETLRPFPR